MYTKTKKSDQLTQKKSHAAVLGPRFLCGTFCGQDRVNGGRWERAVFSLKEADGGTQALYRLFTLSLRLLFYPVDSTGISIFMYQGQVKAALIKGTITALNFTEVILKVCNSKGKRERKTDWATAGKSL